VPYPYREESASTVSTGAPPVFTSPPLVSGPHVAGQPIVCTWAGAIQNTVDSLTYLWLADGLVIGGAGTAASYVVQPGNYGHAVSVQVTATNAFGVAKAESARRLIIN
jgi:hypothetical protein